MQEEEKKKYILKTWKISSGERITEMLKRYWKVIPKEEPKEKNITELAEDIFNN